jgi:hypothetical protein
VSSDRHFFVLCTAPLNRPEDATNRRQQNASSSFDKLGNIRQRTRNEFFAVILKQVAMSCMWQPVYAKIRRAAKSLKWRRSSLLELPECKKGTPPPPYVIAEQRCFIRKLLSHTIKCYQPVILEPLMASYFRFGASGFRCVPGSDFTSHFIVWKDTASVCLHNNVH